MGNNSYRAMQCGGARGPGRWVLIQIVAPRYLAQFPMVFKDMVYTIQ